MKLRDLAGQVFGRLTVMSRVSPPGERVRWSCRCSCGGEKSVVGGDLIGGRTKSCGCLLLESASATIREYNADPRSVETRLLASKKGASKIRRGTEGTLDAEYRRHVSQGDARGCGHLARVEWDRIVRMPCHYCGDVDTRISSYARRVGNLSDAIRINGIDRYDNARGYVDNSVPCCGGCNGLKGGIHGDAFIARVRKIASHVG